MDVNQSNYTALRWEAGRRKCHVPEHDADLDGARKTGTSGPG
jgi:hypothetical protein